MLFHHTTAIERLREAAHKQGLAFKPYSGGYYMMTCPIADHDNTPSVTVTPTSDSFVMHCQHGSHSNKEIMRALGLPWNGFYDNPREASRPYMPRSSSFSSYNRDSKIHDAVLRVKQQRANRPWKPVGAFMMPTPIQYEEYVFTLAQEHIYELCGLAFPRVDGVCPACGSIGTFHFTACNAPLGTYPSFTLLACTACTPHDLLDYMKAHGIEEKRMSVSDTHVFIADTENGFTAQYDDGHIVTRTSQRRARNDDPTQYEWVKQISQTRGTGTHPPYLLNLAARYAHQSPSHTLFITEGEKDAVALFSLGYPTISTLGGAGHVKKRTDTELMLNMLQGLHVVAICDNDERGNDWRSQVQNVFTSHVNPSEVCSLTFIQTAPPLHDGGDAVATHCLNFNLIQQETQE